MAEQLIRNQQVGGSSPLCSTTYDRCKSYLGSAPVNEALDLIEVSFHYINTTMRAFVTRQLPRISPGWTTY